MRMVWKWCESMRRFWVIGLIAFVVLFVACGASDPQFRSVEDVINALDQHTFSNEGDVIYQLVGAFDGAKYDVSPGDYRIEIYVYRAKGKIPSLDEMTTADSQVHVEDNVMLILHTTDPARLGEMVADLKDG